MMQEIGIGVRSARAFSFLAIALASVVSSVATYAQELPRSNSDNAGRAAVNASEPVLVVSIASLNKLMQDVQYASATAGQPQAGGLFTMIVGGYAKGLDMSRPIGVIVPIVDGAPEPIGLIPTPDAESMLKGLEAQGQIGAIDRLDDGTLVVPAGPSLVYIRQAGQWAIVARQKEVLNFAPADPASALTGLGDKYTLGARLNVQQIPAEAREGLIRQLREGFENAMARQTGDAEQFQDASEDSIKQFEQLIREAKELMFGFNINPERKVVTIDTRFIAAKGTEMAEMYAGQKAVASKYASVINDDNAMFYHAAASISPKVAERTIDSLSSAKSVVAEAIDDIKELGTDEKEQVKILVEELLKQVSKTIQEGKFDVGVQALADDGELEITAGMFVSDGAAAAKLVKDISDKLEGITDAPIFSFDEETYKGVTLHSVKIAIPEKQAELQGIFGQTAEIKIGTAPKAVFISLGTESEKTIKAFIDNGSDNDDPTDRPLGQMQIRLLPFLRFAQSIQANDVVASMIDSLSQNKDTDYLSLESQMIPDGQTSNVEIGEGILKAAGAAYREAQMQRMKQMQKQQGGGQF